LFNKNNLVIAYEDRQTFSFLIVLALPARSRLLQKCAI